MLPNEKQALIHRERASRLVDEGRMGEAVRELAEALRQDTRESGSWLLLGEIYGAAGYHEPAASYFQKCIQEDFANERAWIGLANVYSQIGGPYLDLAMEQIDMAGLDHPDLHYLKGSVYAQQGQVERAKAALGEALKLNPSHPYAKHDLDALGGA